MPPDVSWTRDLDQAMGQAALDSLECDLVRRSVVESLRKGKGCEIEQAVRMPGTLSPRLRACVLLDFGFDGQFTGGRVSLERDGEAVMEWGWTAMDQRQDDLATAGSGEGVAIAEMRNALTAIMLHAAAVSRTAAGAGSAGDVAACCEHIVADARRVWALFSASPLRAALHKG